MASLTPTFLLLFSFFVITSAFHTPSPSPSTTITTLPLSPPPTTFLHLSPPPTTFSQPQDLPPQQPLQLPQFNSIINSIIGAGDFNTWTNLLSLTDPSIFPLSATIFIPDDTTTTTTTPTSLSPLLFTYHIIPRRFTFDELCQFPTGARLPTLLPGNTLLITNNSAVNFTINAAMITRPDFFHNSVVVLHGVSGVLDYTHFGGDSYPPAIANPPMLGVSAALGKPTFAPMSIESSMRPAYPSPTYPVFIEAGMKSPVKSLSRSVLHGFLFVLAGILCLILGFFFYRCYCGSVTC